MTAQAMPGTGCRRAVERRRQTGRQVGGVGELGRGGRLDAGGGQLGEVVLPARHGLLVALLLGAGRGDGAERGQAGGHLGAQTVDLGAHRRQDAGGTLGDLLDGGGGRGDLAGWRPPGATTLRSARTTAALELAVGRVGDRLARTGRRRWRTRRGRRGPAAG